MNNTHINKSFDKINLDWKLIQSELKLKLGIEVYESWIKKIDLHEEFNNYILRPLLELTKEEINWLNLS